MPSDMETVLVGPLFVPSLVHDRARFFLDQFVSQLPASWGSAIATADPILSCEIHVS